MNKALWLAVLVSALGTLLIRLLPLLWMQRRLRHLAHKPAADALPQWLTVLGPMMMAALLGVSLVPHPSNTLTWSATLVGILATLGVWHRTRTLGWPVIIGVTAYGLAIFLLSWPEGAS